MGTRIDDPPLLVLLAGVVAHNRLNGIEKLL